MPAGEIAFELFGAVLRFLGRLFFEVIFEMVFKGTGYYVLKVIRPRKEPGEISSAILGIALWVLAIWGGWALFRHFTQRGA